MNELFDKNDIKRKIYVIRGKEVMLDSDLAKLYNCKNGTKTINQAVNRNIEKFPNDFYFQLTEEEIKYLRSQNGTANKMIRSLPYAFTEQGVAMLATVLKTKVAANVSVSIMRAFVEMRHYLNNTDYRLSNVEGKVLELDMEVKSLREVFDSFDTTFEGATYFEGQKYDAYSKIFEILSKAKNRLIIVDNYADNIVLDIIKRININVIIVTKKNNRLTKQDIDKYNSQYNNLKVIYDDTFHDRYFIVDDKVYHCGASINGIGHKTFSITLMNDKELYEILLDKLTLLK